MNPTTEQPLGLTRYRQLLLIVVLVGAALRFYGLGVRGLWIDEAYSWGLTQLPASEFLHGLATRALDMGFYYALLRSWSIFGDSEFALRAFSATCSVLTIPIVAEVGRKLYGARVGLLSAMLFSLHVFSLHYAQEARSYALVILLAALGWLQLIRITEKPSDANWFLFAVISTLEFYSHFLALLNVGAQLLTLLWMTPLRSQLRSTMRGIGMLLIGILPASGYVLRHAGDTNWIPPLGWTAVREFLDSVAGQIGSRIYLALVALLFAFFVYRWLAVWRTEGPGKSTWAASIPVLGFALPVATLLLISLRQPLFIPRYMAATVLPFVWGMACLCRMPRRFSTAATMLALVALAWAVPSHFRDFTLAPVRFQDLRGSVQYIARQQQPGDVILIWEPLLRPGLEYYARGQSSFPEPLFPSGAHLRPDDIGALPDPNVLPPSLQRHPRVWLARLAHDTTGRPGWSAFLKHSAKQSRVRVSEFHSKGMIVEEFAPAAP